VGAPVAAPAGAPVAAHVGTTVAAHEGAPVAAHVGAPVAAHVVGLWLHIYFLFCVVEYIAEDRFYHARAAARKYGP